MIDIYGGVGKTMQSTGLLNNKSLLKQSNLVKEISNQASVINTVQSVMIYKLTEATLNYSNQKIENNKNDDADDKKIQDSQLDKIQNQEEVKNYE